MRGRRARCPATQLQFGYEWNSSLKQSLQGRRRGRLRVLRELTYLLRKLGVCNQRVRFVRAILFIQKHASAQNQEARTQGSPFLESYSRPPGQRFTQFAIDPAALGRQK